MATPSAPGWPARAQVLRFDTIYAALGLRGRSDLAVRLGAAHDDDGMLLVDDHQRTGVPGSTRWATWWLA